MTSTPQPNGSIAPLRNVQLMSELVERVLERPPHLPGLATFHGFSGFGKTYSATYASNRFGARYIEVGESWTKKKLCTAILAELGIHPHRTIADMIEQIIEALATDGVPLIIDEADYLVQRGMIQLVREVHDKSQAPVILIGEERLPDKLQQWERVHNRILDWVAAQPADQNDVRLLAGLYVREVAITDDLLAEVGKASMGRIRRICVNLERVREVAARLGLDKIGLAEWGNETMFSGRPPTRRM